MASANTSGVLSVVATPIGNLEDMTYRAVRILSEADVIAAEDTRSAQALLAHCAIRGKRLLSFFAGNEAARTASLVRYLEKGCRVALICKAGTPGISDPGQRLVGAAAEAGFPVEVVPGPVAAIAALVGSGLASERFLFVGFLPRAAGARRELIGSLRGQPATLIFYESPERLADALRDLDAGLGSGRRAALARELTKVHEEFVRGTLGELLQRYRNSSPRGECTLVVEGAVAPPPETDIEAELGKLFDQGLGPKDAASRLVVTTGKPRRQLYQLALSLLRQRERGSSGKKREG